MRSPLWALFMGFEHENIHLETSSVLFRQLPVSSVVRPVNWKYASTAATEPSSAPANELVGTKESCQQGFSPALHLMCVVAGST